jgi:hypothetical protein
MRSYIFTDHERKLIRAFLDGKIAPFDLSLRHIRSRMKHFKALANDVNLYLLLEDRLAKSETAAST